MDGSFRRTDWALEIFLQVLTWVGPIAGKLLDRIAERFLQDSGAYEVKEYLSALDVLDSSGRRAVHIKEQRVRFLRDHITHFTEYGWGSGDSFASHRARPGRIVDRRQVGSRYRSLIVLPEPQNSGDELNLSVRRLVRNGLRDRRNWLEAEIYHKTRRAELRVTVPGSRPLLAARMIDRKGETTSQVPITTTSDGRRQACCIIATPQPGNRYTLEWDW